MQCYLYLPESHVIAIIGILAVIAIPNFIVCRQQGICAAVEKDAHSLCLAVQSYFALPSHNPSPGWFQQFFRLWRTERILEPSVVRLIVSSSRLQITEADALKTVQSGQARSIPKH